MQIIDICRVKLIIYSLLLMKLYMPCLTFRGKEMAKDVVTVIQDCDKKIHVKYITY